MIFRLHTLLKRLKRAGCSVSPGQRHSNPGETGWHIDSYDVHCWNEHRHDCALDVRPNGEVSIENYLNGHSVRPPKPVQDILNEYYPFEHHYDGIIKGLTPKPSKFDSKIEREFVRHMEADK